VLSVLVVKSHKFGYAAVVLWKLASGEHSSAHIALAAGKKRTEQGAAPDPAT
jgi:hypothetical protein